MSLTDSQKIDQISARTDVLYLAMADLLGHEKFSKIVDYVIENKSAQMAVMEAQGFLSESSDQ